MPLYLSQHTLACLTRQGADALAQRFLSADAVKTGRILVNMVEGKMFCEFRAEKGCTLTGCCGSSGSPAAGPSSLPFSHARRSCCMLL